MPLAFAQEDFLVGDMSAHILLIDRSVLNNVNKDFQILRMFIKFCTISHFSGFCECSEIHCYNLRYGFH